MARSEEGWLLGFDLVGTRRKGKKAWWLFRELQILCSGCRACRAKHEWSFDDRLGWSHTGDVHSVCTSFV